MASASSLASCAQVTCGLVGHFRLREGMTIHRSLGWPGRDAGWTQSTNDQLEVSTIMGALDPEVLDIVWEAVCPLIPPPEDDRPLGCHRRASDRDCFRVMMVRLVTGCSWEDGAALWHRRVGHDGASPPR